MGTHGPQRKLEKCFDVILQDETERDTYLKVIICFHFTNLINTIVLDYLIKDCLFVCNRGYTIQYHGGL